MKLLITGGAGFIGSNFIKYMLQTYTDYKIVCLDKLTYAGNINTLSDIYYNSNFRFVKGDIADKKIVNALFEQEKFDIVVNFAAETHVDRAIDNSGVFMQTNIIGTHTLLDACNRYGVSRFHQISTDEVYGELPLSSQDLFTESTPLNPSNPYSASKASADHIVMSYYKTYGTPVSISRCTNNYGAYQFPEKLIPLTIINALCDKQIPVYGDGLNVRDWISVDDHCRAIDSIIHKGNTGEIYNVGANNELSNIDIVKLVLQKLGKPYSLIQFVADRKGHDRRYALNVDKIKHQLGFKVHTEFLKGIEATIQWYVDNKKWWQDIISGIYLENNARKFR